MIGRRNAVRPAGCTVRGNGSVTVKPGIARWAQRAAESAANLRGNVVASEMCGRVMGFRVVLDTAALKSLTAMTDGLQDEHNPH